MKGGYEALIFCEKNRIDCANPCLEEIRPVEMLLPKKWRKKFAFLSPHVGCPGKAFLDHASVSKLYPWAKSNIKCSNRKNWHVRGHRYAIPPRPTSPLPPLPIKILRYCPHVHVACMLRTPQQYTVVPFCGVALAFNVHDLHILCLSHQLTSPRLTLPPSPLTHIHHMPHITTHITQDSQAGWPHNTGTKHSYTWYL